jgi:hypothetical protein
MQNRQVSFWRCLRLFSFMFKNEHLCCSSFRHDRKRCAPPQLEVSVMTPTAGAQEQSRFRPEEIPCHHRRGSKSCGHPKKLTVFTQGDAADAVCYVQEGKVRLAEVSKIGKEATIGVFGPGRFLRRRRPCRTAFAHGVCNRDDGRELLHVDKKAMMRAIHREHMFLRYFRRLSTGTKHSIRRRSGRPTFQFQRKATGSDSALACSSW